MTPRNPPSGKTESGFDAAYLHSHACASWAYLLATREELEAGIERMDEFGEYGTANRRIIADALAKRFGPAPASPGEPT